MNTTELAGTIAALLGAGIGIASIWFVVIQLANRRRSVAVRVQAIHEIPDGQGYTLQPLEPSAWLPQAGTLLRLTSEEVHVVPGDTFRVYLNRKAPGFVHIYSPDRLVAGFGSVFLALTLIYASVGASSASSAYSPAKESSVLLVFIGTFLCCLGIIAVTFIFRLARNWSGSRKIQTVVLESKVFSGSQRKQTYRAKVQFHLDGVTRYVWGPPVVMRPVRGDRKNIRVSGQAPYHALSTTPLSIFFLACFLITGIVGWFMLIMIGSS